jgi:predicted transcriptional regulator
MSKADMTEKIFDALYNSWEHNTSCFLDQLCKKHGWDKETFEDLVEDLESKDLIERRAQWDFKATSQGILFAERQEIIPKERSSQHRETRRKVLLFLAKFRKEKGKREIIHYEKMCQEAGIDKSLFVADESILRGEGLVKMVSTGCYQITDEGMERV